MCLQFHARRCRTSINFFTDVPLRPSGGVFNFFIMKTTKKLIITGILSAAYLSLACFSARAQDSVLTLQKALNIALSKQQILKAKDNYAKATAEGIISAKRD